MCPQSDVDVVLVHAPKLARKRVKEVADSVWYPLWDSGVSIDHSVRTATDVLDAMRSDVRVTLGLLDIRSVAGDPGLVLSLAGVVGREFRKNLAKYVALVNSSFAQRYATFGSLYGDLEPSLKESKGGIRDAALLGAITRLFDFERVGLGGDEREEYSAVLDLRTQLYRYNPKAGDRLSLFDQDAMADQLGMKSKTELLWNASEEAEKVASRLCRVLMRAASGFGTSKSLERVKLGNPQASVSVLTILSDGQLDGQISSGVTLSEVLGIGTFAAQRGLLLSRRLLYSVGENFQITPEYRWSERERDALIGFLQSGEGFISIWRALDTVGFWSAIFPEWAEVRFLRKPNAFHRYCVDEHLLETVRVASSLRAKVHRSDLLLLASLFHDVGKHSEEDHCVRGAQIVDAIAMRLGLDDYDRAIVVSLVRNHLLLAEVITRRDLSDPRTIETVADLVEAEERLELLDVLGQADSVATGVLGYSSWKKTLVSELIFKVRVYLRDGRHLERRPSLDADLFDELKSKAESGCAVVATSDHLYVAAKDKIGLFATVTGSLSVAGISVMSADVFMVEGVAVEVFRVSSWAGGEPNYSKFKSILNKALKGDISLSERIDTIQASSSRQKIGQGLETSVKVVTDASELATVVEVVASNRRGLLYALASEIARHNLDIRHAKVMTMGMDVVDTFYLVTSEGKPIDSTEALTALMDSLAKAV